MESIESKINNCKSFTELWELMYESYESKIRQLLGAGILNLTDIKSISFDKEQDLIEIKTLLIENINTFVILFAYGSEDLFLFSKEPEEIDINVYSNFCGHGTSIILENMPKKIFIYGEDD